MLPATSTLQVPDADPVSARVQIVHECICMLAILLQMQPPSCVSG